MPEKIRVLVIDDSAMVRKVITDTLHQDPDIEVVGTAQDPLFAIEKIPKLRPDVLTLDMEMPRMDGLTFLRKLKAEKSTIPVVVVSALTQQGSQMALDAMEAGACDILAKPDGSYSIGALAGRLAFHVKAAARSRRQPQLTPVKTAPASGSVRPVAIASSAICEPCCVSALTTTTGMVDFSALSLRRNVSPSMRGISMSSVSTSGRSLGIFSIANNGSWAVPTTSMSGSWWSVSVITLRTIAESSITNTRIFSGIACLP
ncbi:MAG: hypothetical protein RLY92_935 [Chloroflexota bacterium]